MNETHRALEALGDAYISRGTHQQRVKARYANYQRELDEARQADIDEVAQALVAAWNAGATVAATGRAMGSSNIYNSRRAYYDRAREIQGEADQDDNELLDRLFRQARGEDTLGSVKETAQLILDAGALVKRGLEQSAAGETVDLGDFTQYAEDEKAGTDGLTPHGLDLREWVESWTLEYVDGTTTKVHDPQERVESIRLGFIQGFKDKGNLAEFMKDKELADLVSDIHGIETKVTA